ncbi:uncharacterized protein LOC128740291 [Sabethes cyaneus]|uniref:uncharacterized protein LOC128740291 n=1 Tax=Sabethes cyaneus TaxID=53552 RepID=UPI00237D9A0F|nr:uncharacterized protein LOC128740291 [Sabethes cyaneus]
MTAKAKDEENSHQRHWSDEEFEVPSESGTSGQPTLRSIPTKRRFSGDSSDDETSGLGPQKKLCRFFFLDHCSKANCRYMHSEFPCKYYYFGLKCSEGHRCKLRHGKALQPDMQEALWNHVRTAPANMLQRFPCFPEVILQKTFDERHRELLLMEQEGLIEDNYFPKIEPAYPVYSTLISEAIKTQLLEEAVGLASELKDILTCRQIVSLANNGVRSKSELLALSATKLVNLGIDNDTLMKVKNFPVDCQDSCLNEVKISADKANIADLELSAPKLEEQAVSAVTSVEKQELQNNLNDDTSSSTVSITSSFEITPTSSNNSNDEGNETLSNCLDKCTVNFKEKNSEQPAVFRIGSLLNQGYTLSQMESLEKKQGVHLTLTGTTEYKATHSENLGDLDSTAIESFESDGYDKLQQMLNSENEDPNNSNLESAKRILEQIRKLDSFASDGKEVDVAWNNTESDLPVDIMNTDTSVVDSAFQTNYNNDNQTGLPIPFQSSIDQYTPAQEIEASCGKFPFVSYSLIPIDIPVPNLQRVRQSFEVEPKYSLDPRIRIMFNVGSSEARPCTDALKISARDPRLNKQQAP